MLTKMNNHCQTQIHALGCERADLSLSFRSGISSLLDFRLFDYGALRALFLHLKIYYLTKEAMATIIAIKNGGVNGYS